MRLRAYQELGIKDIWVSVVHPKSEAEKLEMAITDNEASGRWQEEQLAKYLEQYKGEIDLGNYQVDLGNPVSLDELLSKYGPEPEEDEVPEVQEEAVSKLGEVYQLGRHRVMCGSATDIDNVKTLLGDTKIDIVLTDPPYGIDVVQGGTVGATGETHFGSVGGGKIAKVHQYSEIIGDNTTDTARDAYNLCVSLGIQKQIYWGGNYFTDFLPPSPCWLIWNKKNTGNFADVEMAWTNFTTGAKLYDYLWNGLSREGDRKSELVSRVHPTQKPVGLHVNILKDYSEEQSTVLDLFLGSGSTLIACEQTNRICYGMEIDPKYVDVCRKRYHRFITGSEEGWEDATKAIS